MTNKVQIPTPVKGYGYAGKWSDGRIGWFMPRHVSGAYDRKSPDDGVDKDSHQYMKGERIFLCEIIVKPLKDKKGRPITKIVR